jgi:hypothetical protein
MAQRPVFVPRTDGSRLVQTLDVTFEWFPGLSLAQKQRSIDSLHATAVRVLETGQVLEVSSKSKDELGRALSAFNLTLTMPRPIGQLSVECAFQGSKVFENGGPYTDIYGMSSRDAKRDDRLRTSGQLTGFRFMGVDWPLEPRTAFYDWLYVGALRQHPDLAERVTTFAAFTDIEFNPEKSINCQAYSVALHTALSGRGIPASATFEKASFLQLVQGQPASNMRLDDSRQGTLL